MTDQVIGNIGACYSRRALKECPLTHSSSFTQVKNEYLIKNNKNEIIICNKM